MSLGALGWWHRPWWHGPAPLLAPEPVQAYRMDIVAGGGGGDVGRQWRRLGRGRVRVDSVRGGVLLVPRAVDVFW